MNSDTTARPDLPPRGVVLATGERLPDGQSTNARMFLVSLAPAQDGTAMAARLTEAQRHRESYALAMSGYLAWLAGQDATFAPALTQRFNTFRTDAQTAGAHTRQPGAVAHLMLAWETWTQYALESGALAADARAAILHEVWRLVRAAAAAQADSLQTLRPDQIALDLLRDGLAGKRAYLETLDGKAPEDGAYWGWVRDVEREDSGTLRRPPGGVLLGYVDVDWLYLLPEAHYQFLSKAARDAGQTFPVEKDTLHKHMDTAGLIQSHVEQGRRRLTVHKKPYPGRLLKFKRLRFPTLVGTADCVGTVQPLDNTGAEPPVPTVPTNCGYEGAPIEPLSLSPSSLASPSSVEDGEKGSEGEKAYASVVFSGYGGNRGNYSQETSIDTGTNAVPTICKSEESVGTVGTATQPPPSSGTHPRTDGMCASGFTHLWVNPSGDTRTWVCKECGAPHPHNPSADDSPPF